MGSVKIQMNKKTKALVAAGVLVIATAGGAYAYWSTTGTAAGLGLDRHQLGVRRHDRRRDRRTR